MNTRSITEYAGYELLSIYTDLCEYDIAELIKNEEYDQEEKPETSFSSEEIRKELSRRLGLTEPATENNSKLTLKGYSPIKYGDRESDDNFLAKYQLKHTTSGPNGTTLVLNVDLEIDTREYASHYPNGTPQKVNKIKANIDFSGIQTETIEEALVKLSEWCERAGKAIKNRKPSEFSLPI